MILDDIIKVKEQEVAALRAGFAGKDPMKLIEGLPPARKFLNAFQKGKFSLIAEIKKASPSAGLIRSRFEPTTLAKAYQESGAAAISVLTDQQFFQGKLDDLKAAKDSTTIPILRKDFIIDELQVYESRIGGADAILLISKILAEVQLVKLLKLAEELGMQALVEVHNSKELEKALEFGAKIIGINNRDLKTFQVNRKNAIVLVQKYPELREKIVISESGIKKHEDIKALKEAGVDGVLIGETLLKSNNIPAKVKELLG